MGMDDITPQSIVDRFLLLSAANRIEFGKLLGRELTAELAHLICGRLQPIEFQRFVDMIMDETWRSTLPSMVNAAIRISRESPELQGEDFERAIVDFHVRELQLISRDSVKIETDKLKQQRNRKSSPKTIRRNIEICDLRRRDPKHWSHGRLAKKFGVTDRMIRSVLTQEKKWRRLAIQMRIN